jgi:hypothetical protein
MIKFPSNASAALTGFFVTPLLVLGTNYIEVHRLGQGILLLWVLPTFFIPVILSVTDFAYWRRRVKELGSVFRPMASSDDFKHFYVPAWKRMFVWFVASVVSMMALTLFGVVQ